MQSTQSQDGDASRELGFVHRFEPAGDPAARPILALHGTGGNENDLLALARQVSPGSAILAPRGKVLERGMPRFFARLAEGVFDEAEVGRRADELADFVEEACTRYGIERPFALGFSNGANIASAVLTRRPGLLGGAILLRAMRTFRESPRGVLSGEPVLVQSGANDPIVSGASATALAGQLSAAGAKVTHRSVLADHQLTRTDVDFVTQWLGRLP